MRLTGLAVATAILLCTSGSGWAAMLNLTVVGQIGSASLGDPNPPHPYALPDLTGHAITLTYAIDLSQGAVTFTPDPSAPTGVHGAQLFSFDAFPEFGDPQLIEATVHFAGADDLTNTFASGREIPGYATSVDVDRAGSRTTMALSLLGPGMNSSFAFTGNVSFGGRSLLSGFSHRIGGADSATATASLLFPIGDFTDTLDLQITPERLSLSAVPLPSTLPLLGLALIGLGAFSGLRRHQAGRLEQTAAPS